MGTFTLLLAMGKLGGVSTVVDGPYHVHSLCVTEGGALTVLALAPQLDVMDGTPENDGPFVTEL